MVANTVEQHAELLLANDLALQDIKVVGDTIAVRHAQLSETGTITHRSDREAMEMLLLECKRLLAERTLVNTTLSLQQLREQILENACKCFSGIVEYYTSGRLTRTVIERDSKYRPVPIQVPFTIPESKIFNIAITPGPMGTLQASLVYGEPEDLKCAIRGNGKQTYYEAIDALLKVIVKRIQVKEEAKRTVKAVPTPAAPPPSNDASDRLDSPMEGFDIERVQEIKDEMEAACNLEYAG